MPEIGLIYKIAVLINDFKRSAKEIAQAYRSILSLLKREFNVKDHLVSLNKNGMQVILYMMLIVAMIVLIYKKANNIAYKTSKRCFAMEVRDLAIAIIGVQYGGDPGLFLKYEKWPEFLPARTA
ncbi:hypothetical protein [Chitinophaga oryziterrae]|uniref:hypothetical protein n=1 Tax=Chitinophaga oryziterrae TaxID=1031224 RepID=UPI00196B6F8E|nr:hypothetical protein [Chitinophaga oryziterrae]